jgi:uncharacterized Zn-finger protein
MCQLKRHFSINSNEKRIKCHFENCNKVFKNQNSLQIHQKIHLGEKFACLWPESKYETVNKSYLLIKYDSSVLSDERKFKCDYENCDKTFKARKSLKQHILLHHLKVKKLFECDWNQCSEKFFNTTSLSRHKNSVHLKIKNIECSFKGCHQTFSTKDNFKLHLTPQKGDKHYVCSYEDCENICPNIKSERTYEHIFRYRKIQMQLQ